MLELESELELYDSAVLDGLKYSNSHEWVKHEGSVATVGITDHAQVSILLQFCVCVCEKSKYYYWKILCIFWIDSIQGHLGEVVFVELPESGTSVSKGAGFGAVESVKATSDVNSPISGEVIEVNTKLSETPGLVYIIHQRKKKIQVKNFVFFCSLIHCLLFFQINSSPYEDGWMIKVKPSSPAELDSLMGSKEYTKFCEEEDAHH